LSSSEKTNHEVTRKNAKSHEKKFMAELVLKEEVYQIVGAAMDVYYTLGSGFLEPVYQEALEIELARRNIPFEAQRWLRIEYKRDRSLRKTIRLTLYVTDKSLLR